MKPSELYTRKPESATNNINVLRTSYCNHIPEIPEWIYFQDDSLQQNTEVFIKTYKDFYFDSRRCWTLASVWFEDKPVMVIQNAGREGDDYSARFVTDRPLYKKMIEFIRTLVPESCEEKIDVVDPEQDIPNLTEFYEHKLDGDFQKYPPFVG